MSEATATAPEPVLIELGLVEIEQDTDTQSRVSVDTDQVEEYGREMEDGVRFDPITVYYDGVRYWIADGWHRFLAAQYASKNRIAAKVYRGSKRDAIWHGLGANRHGLPRSNDDKRKAVETCLIDPEWSAYSDSAIADHCGCSRRLVGKIRSEMARSEVIEEGGTVPPAQTDSLQSAVDKANAEAKPESGIVDEPEEDDEFEEVLPEVDEVIEHLAAPYTKHINAIQQVINWMRETAGVPDEGGHLRNSVTRLVNDAQNLRAGLRQLTPVERCPHCDGVGCDRCLGTGFLTRALVESRKGA